MIVSTGTPEIHLQKTVGHTVHVHLEKQPSGQPASHVPSEANCRHELCALKIRQCESAERALHRCPMLVNAFVRYR